MAQANNIEALKFAWDVVRNVAVGAWVVTPILWRYLKPRWEERSYMELSPSRRGAKGLRRLANTLGRMRFWLRYDSEMTRRIRRSLFRAENEIMTESFSYIAVHSNKNEERCSALRFLSQVEGEEIMKYAEGIINAVLSDGSASDEVRKVAKVALKELNNRQRMITQ